MIALRIAIGIALVYASYTFYTRWSESKDAERRVLEKSAEQAKEDVARLGGDALKITAFYANPTAISKGQTSRLCYGVINATVLELTPPVEKVWPSLSRCFDVSPRESTTYRLSAHGKGGVVSNSLNVTVQ